MASTALFFIVTTFGVDIIRFMTGVASTTTFNDIEFKRAYHFELYQNLVDKYNRNKLKLDDPRNSRLRDYYISKKLLRIEHKIIAEFEKFKKYDDIYQTISQINNISIRRNSI